LAKPPVAELICKEDKFSWNKGAIETHEVDWSKPRGDVYAVYAIAVMKDGGEVCAVMTRDEVEGIRKRSRAANDGPWVTDWNEMAKKTVFRRLSKWLVLSPEYRDALDADADELDVTADVAVGPRPIRKAQLLPAEVEIVEPEADPETTTPSEATEESKIEEPDVVAEEAAAASEDEQTATAIRLDLLARFSALHKEKPTTFTQCKKVAGIKGNVTDASNDQLIALDEALRNMEV